MRRSLACALLVLAMTGGARAACKVEDAGIETAIAAQKELREPENAQMVRDLRLLRDAAIMLDSYRFPEECARLVAIVKGLLAHPESSIKRSGDTDEEKAEEVEEAREPKAPVAPKDTKTESGKGTATGK